MGQAFLLSPRDCWGDDYLTQGKNKVLAPILPVPLNWAQWELGKSHTDCFACTRGRRGRKGGEEGEREEEKRGVGEQSLLKPLGYWEVLMKSLPDL